MRVRNRKGATELLEANPQYVVLNPEDAKGKWHEIFGNDHPIHIEVGSGKGAFITGMARDVYKRQLFNSLIQADIDILANSSLECFLGFQWSLQARTGNF